MKKESDKSGVEILAVDLGSESSLWKLYSRAVAEGQVFVPTRQVPPIGEEARVAFFAGPLAVPPVMCRVTQPAEENGCSGFHAVVTFNKAFRHFFSKRGTPREHARRRRTGRRASNRYSTRLEVTFENFRNLRLERASNLSEGGMFVQTLTPPPVGSRVQVSMHLPKGEKLTTEARVVHVVTAEQAKGEPYSPGVGLSFKRAGREFKERLRKLLAEFESTPLRLLVVDDDDAFRDALSGALEMAGMRVETAGSGEEALRKLIDHLFELDAVLLDVLMPGLDGCGFLDRVRHLGGELDLPIIVLSGADRTALEPLRGPDRANEILTKTEPLEVILARLHQVIGR